MAISTILLDLDGVIRHFDPSRAASIEAEHGLAAGALEAAAYDPDLIHQLVTGRITLRHWADHIGERVGHTGAAHAWLADRGRIDQAMIDEVDGLRAAGYVVAVLTNGTDTVPAEMADAGLTGRFDRIFNTAEIGFAKPDHRAYEHVCQQLAVEPAAVFFTDDRQGNVDGANAYGLTSRLFEGVDTFRHHLDTLVRGVGGRG